jgi:hypothetical protein
MTNKKNKSIEISLILTKVPSLNTPRAKRGTIICQDNVNQAYGQKTNNSNKMIKNMVI